MNTREHILAEIAAHYDTDKLGHGYIKYYSEKLPNKCPRLLEIGIAKGASALMWDTFFGQNEIDLHLLDLYLDENHVSSRWARNHGFLPIIGDQSDLNLLSSIPYKYNVIIDDGSHQADHMLISFKHLFHNNMASGGQYWIEDIACNFDPFYWAGEVKSLDDTPYTMFKNYIETGKIVNPYFNEGESEIFENLIDKVEILCDNKLILITRK